MLSSRSVIVGNLHKGIGTRPDMGTGQSSKIVGYNELRNSLPGSLVPENDLEWFFSNCVVETMQTEPVDETVQTLSDVLYPRPSQLFYVVISGEVLLQMKRGHQKVVTVATYTAGETIHFFNSNLASVFAPQSNPFGDFFTYGNIKLAYHFNRAHTAVSSVLGMNAPGYAKFKSSATSNIQALTSLLQLGVWDVMSSSPFWKSITLEQTRAFSMFLKVQLHYPGSVLKLRGHTMKSMYTDDLCEPASTGNVGADVEVPDPGTTPTAPVAAPATSVVGGSVALLLHGTVLSVPTSTNYAAVVSKVTDNKGAAGLAKPAPATGFLSRSPRTTLIQRVAPAVFTPLLTHHTSSLTSSHTSNATAAPTTGHTFEYSYATSYYEGYHGHVIMKPGAVLGADVYCVQSSDISARAYVTSSPCVVAYISTECLEILCGTDSRLYRVFCRNYYYYLLQWMRSAVPLLMDMDTNAIALLSCKVQLVHHAADSTVHTRGCSGDSAFIVVAGSCKELVPTSTTANTITVGTSTPAVISATSSADGNGAAMNSAADAGFALVGATTTTLPVPQAATTAVVHRVVAWGGLCGEIALAANEPYLYTVMTREASLALQIPHNILAQIYHTQKQALNTMRIKLLGTHVDIMYVLFHPQGFLALYAYLKKSGNVRYIEFYSKIVRYDKLCGVVCKMYAEVCRLREKVCDVHSGIVSDAMNVPSTSHTTSMFNPIATHVYTTPVKTASSTAADSVKASVKNRGTSSKAITPANSSDSEVADINYSVSRSVHNTASKTMYNASGEDEHKNYPVLVKPMARSSSVRGIGSVGGTSVIRVAIDNIGGAVAAVDDGAKHTTEPNDGTHVPDVHFNPIDSIHTIEATNNGSSSATTTPPTIPTIPMCTLESRADFDASPDLSPAASPVQAGESAFMNSGASSANFLHTPNYTTNTTKTINPTSTTSTAENTPAYQAELQLRIKRHTLKIIKNIVELHEYARTIVECYIFEHSVQQLKLHVALRVRTEREYSAWGKNVCNIQGKGDVVSSVTSNIGRFRVLPVNEVEQYGGDITAGTGARNPTHNSSMYIDTTLPSTGYNTTSASPTHTTLHSPHSPHSRSGSPQFPINTGSRELSFHVRRVNNYSERVNSISSKTNTAVIPMGSSKTTHMFPACTNDPIDTSVGTSDNADHYYLFEIIDMSFVHLFEDCKTEVLRFMRHEKYSGWKATPEFHTFLAGVKLYERLGEKSGKN